MMKSWIIVEAIKFSDRKTHKVRIKTVLEANIPLMVMCTPYNFMW